MLAAWQSLSEGWKWVQGALHRLLWACLDNCAKSTTTTTSAAASSAASGGHGASSSSSSSSDMTKRYSRLSAAAATAEIAKDVNFNGDRFEARASAVHRASSQRIKLIRCGTLPAADEELLPPVIAFLLFMCSWTSYSKNSFVHSSIYSNLSSRHSIFFALFFVNFLFLGLCSGCVVIIRTSGLCSLAPLTNCSASTGACCALHCW